MRDRRRTCVSALIVTGLVLIQLTTGCRRDPGAETASNPMVTSPENPQKPGTGDDKQRSDPGSGGVNSQAAGGTDPGTGDRNPVSPDTDDPDIDAMIRLAAGPLADQVNSSLARLNTNLGKKEHTLVIMAMKSETRRWYFLTHFMGIIDDAQFIQASDIIDSYADEYQDLLDRRAMILENARDGQGVEQMLEFNKVAAIKLSIMVRRQLIREVLDKEQKKQYAAQFEPQPSPANSKQLP